MSADAATKVGVYPIERAASVPRPARRLWRTRFKRPRPIDRFAPVLSGAAQTTADDAELARHGRVLLLEDLLVVQHRDGTVSTRTHVVVQLHSDEHLAQWDDQVWAFDPRVQRIGVHHARSVVDGVATDAEKIVAPYMHAPGVVDARAKIVQLKFPTLVPGVVIDFLMQEDFFTIDAMGPAMWRHFFFNTPEPTHRRRIAFAVAPPFEPRFEVHHADLEPEVREEGGYRVWTWDLRDLEAMPIDAWTPPAQDYVPWIDASTLPTWAPVVEQLTAELLPPEVDEALRALLDEIVADVDGVRAQVAKIYDYATRELRYGRHPDHLLDRNRRQASAVVRDLRGDCKDKSALMVALLGALGVESSVAALLTADSGRLPLLPSMRFNHAIVHARVEGADLWMDPASDAFAFGDRPRLNDDVPALLLGADGARMCRVPPSAPEQHATRRICRGRLDADGSYVFRAEVVMRGEMGASLRMQLQGAGPSEREQVVSRWVLEALAGGEVTDVQTSDVDDLTTPLEVAYTVRLERFARQVKDLWLWRVPWDVPLVSTGPMTPATRDAHLAAPPPRLLEDEHHVELPPGFVGYGLPLEIEREAFGGTYALEASFSDGVVRCQRRVVHRGGVVSPTEYGAFRSYWNECARDDAMDLVFVDGEI